MNELLYGKDSINVAVFHLFNNIQDHTFLMLMNVGSAIGKYTMFPVYLLFIALFAWKSSRVKPLLIPIVIAYIVYLAWVFGLKHLLHMPRPFAVLQQGSFFIADNIKNAEDPNVSFPSGHAAFTMMMLEALWLYLSRSGKIIGTSIVLWVGISRIVLGVHFPSDILLSWLASFVTTYFVVNLSRKYFI